MNDDTFYWSEHYDRLRHYEAVQELKKKTYEFYDIDNLPSSPELRVRQDRLEREIKQLSKEIHDLEEIKQKVEWQNEELEAQSRKRIEAIKRDSPVGYYVGRLGSRISGVLSEVGSRFDDVKQNYTTGDLKNYYPNRQVGIRKPDVFNRVKVVAKTFRQSKFFESDECGCDHAEHYVVGDDETPSNHPTHSTTHTDA